MTTQCALQTTMAITKTVGKKREPVGKVTVPMPDLAQVKAMLSADPLGVTTAAEDGIPEYQTDFANWLMRCIAASCRAVARNRLQTGTVELRPGATIPSTLEDITVPPIMGGNGAALAEIAALKKAFKDYASSLGKAAKTAMLIVECFNSPKTFLLQPAAVQAKIEPYFAEFMDAYGEVNLTSTQLAYFEKFTSDIEGEEDAFDDL